MNKFTQKPQRNRGAALLIFVIFFLIISTVLVLGIGRGVYQDLAEYRVLQSSKQSFFGAEAGIEDAIYRHRDGRAYSATESLTLSNVAVNVTRTLVVDQYQFISEGDLGNMVRRSESWLSVGDGASFNFGLQSGNGGILISNNSKIYGNVFSNQTVEGQGNATVYGDIIAAGASGLVESIHATGSVYAHSIDDSVIDGNAYYYDATTKTATIVGGTSFPGWPDQATATMPISDELIEEWKDTIETTGTVIESTSPECAGGLYTIQSNMTLDNVKIECDVDIKKTGSGVTVTFAGPVWIEGNLSFSAGPTIVASSSLGASSVAIIADNELNRATSSQVSINQSTNFSSGNTQSYVVLISMNNSAETGGAEPAIDLAQSANGKVLVYAPHGLVEMGNSISLKEVTAYQINVNNGAEVIYESGLISVLFTGGPGGGYTIASWREVE